MRLFDNLAARIAASQRAKFGHGVPEAIVADAESVLGVRFPMSYRWWLLRYGAGHLGGYELQGLAPVMPSERDPSEIYVGDVVRTALLNRSAGQPPQLLELLDYEGDEVYYLDLSNPTPDGEAPVLCRFIETGELESIAPSFAAFLEREL